MPGSGGVERALGGVSRLRAGAAEVQQRLPVHHLAVSSLAHRERLLNFKTSIKIKIASSDVLLALEELVVEAYGRVVSGFCGDG